MIPLLNNWLLFELLFLSLFPNRDKIQKWLLKNQISKIEKQFALFTTTQKCKSLAKWNNKLMLKSNYKYAGKQVNQGHKVQLTAKASFPLWIENCRQSHDN